jgi:hypothetical protein
MTDNVSLPAIGLGTATPSVATRESGGSHFQKVDIERAQKAGTASTPAQTTQGTSAASVLAANAARKAVIIVNTGLTVIKLALGGTNPTQTAYHVSLQPASAADAGDGGTFVSDTWTGEIRAISSIAGGTMVITELT